MIFSVAIQLVLRSPFAGLGSILTRVGISSDTNDVIRHITVEPNCPETALSCTMRTGRGLEA